MLCWSEFDKEEGKKRSLSVFVHSLTYPQGTSRCFMYVHMHRGCVSYKEDLLSGSMCLVLLCQYMYGCVMYGSSNMRSRKNACIEVYSRQTHRNKQEIAYRFIREVWGISSLSLAKWEDGNVTRWNVGTIGKKKPKLLSLAFARPLTHTKKHYTKVQRRRVWFKDNKLRFRHSADWERLGWRCAKKECLRPRIKLKLKQHKGFKVK